MVPIYLGLKKNLTIKFFVDALIQSINLSGGLQLVESDGSEELPERPQEGSQVDVADITLALPKIKESPYDNVWIPVDDDLTLQSKVFQDFDLLAFKFVDEEAFNIQQPEYVE